MQTDLSWSAVLAHHATRTPDKPMTVFEGETITYGEMAARVAALAGGLAERGIGAEDVVGHSLLRRCGSIAIAFRRRDAPSTYRARNRRNLAHPATGFDANAGPPGSNPTDRGTNVRTAPRSRSRTL